MSAPADVLRPASVTAERERIRLERSAGRSGTGRVLVRASLAVRRLGSPEAASEGLRYRPVAWTVIALLAVAWYLPGRADRAAVPEIAAAPSPVTTAVPSTAPAPTEDPAAPDLGPAAPAPAFQPAPAPVIPPSSGGSASGSFTPPPTTPPTTPPAADEPTASRLTVRGSGWATRLPPTPLPGDDVPEEALPVANRIGNVDRVSFIRLSGEGSTLELMEHADSAREALGTAAVALCPILDESWSEEPEQSFDEMPEWDDDRCVGGSETSDRWIFDLTSFDDPTGEAGFALVPTTDAPPDFQVAFEAG